jgi:16S rRNA (cytosine967-C5)-methyltransferase
MEENMTKVNNTISNKVNTRNCSLTILQNIFEDKAYTNIALDKFFDSHKDLAKIDRSFITRIVEGSVEHVITIDYIINQFSKTKTTKMKKTILNILRLSVYQIKYMDKVPVSAICNEAVKLAKKRKFGNLSGFVNGVLRNIARNINDIKYPDEQKDKISYLSVKYSFPKWLVSMWLKYYDYDTVKQLCSNSNKMVSTSIRCNNTIANVEELESILEKDNVKVEKGALISYALRISGYNNIRSLEAFDKGMFSVQDESSMLVGHIANIPKNSLVVDICAAPGGKTTHCAEILNNTGCVISRDIYPKKLKLIEQNVNRLHLNDTVKIEQYNALELDENLIQKVDVLITDVPCSGLGIIRKKPDIKYNITKEGISDLIKLQRDILKVAYQYVKIGGTLMYSTCTVNPEENIENIKWFLKEYPFELVDISKYLPEDLIQNEEGYIQLLPGIHDTDGFFIAKLRRVDK